MKKYPRTYHLSYSPGATSDDRIAKSHNNLIGSEIVITEKLDGSNTAMTDGGVYGRSHAEYTQNPWDREVRNLHKLVFEDELGEGVYVFGESMEAIHSIEYSNLTSYFYIFGIRDNGIWFPWDRVEEWAEIFDVPTVPVLFKGVVNSEEELRKIVEKLVSEPSELGGEREGVVVRSAGAFHNDDFSDNVMKWVRRGHVQTNSHWTKNWKKSKINY